MLSLTCLEVCICFSQVSAQISGQLSSENKLSFAMISLRLEKFLNGVWNLYQNFHMVTALVLGIPMFQILALHLDKEGAENINVL